MSLVRVQDQLTASSLQGSVGASWCVLALAPEKAREGTCRSENFAHPVDRSSARYPRIARLGNPQKLEGRT
jgi:hypothetical protein